MRQSMWCDVGICDNSHRQDNTHLQCIYTYANDRSQAMGGTQALSRRSETPDVSSLPKGAGMPGTPSVQQSQTLVHARVGLRCVGRCPGGCSFRCSQSGRCRWRPWRRVGVADEIKLHRLVQRLRRLEELTMLSCSDSGGE